MHSVRFAASIASSLLLPLALLGTLRAGVVEQSVKSFDQLVGSYNLITIGNASLRSYGDTEGGIAIGGNLKIDGGVIGAHPEKTGQGSSFASLYVNGTLDYTGVGSTIKLQSGHSALPNIGNGNQWSAGQKMLRHGSTQILSQVNSSDPLGATDPRDLTLNPAWNFATIAQTARALSATFDAAAVTGQISVVGQSLTFTANPSITTGAVVFDLDASLLSGNKYNGSMISNIAIDVPSSLVFVINVLNANGRTLFGSGVNFNYDDGDSRLLWNVVGKSGLDASSQSVTFGNGGQFYGSILAPDFTVKNALNTAINGQILAGAFDYSGAELHYTGFEIPGGPFGVDMPPAPEPSTYGIVAASGLIALAYWRRRFGKKA